MKKIFTLAALIFVQSSYALELQGINGVEILAIDGKDVDSEIFKNPSKPQIEAGEHQIVTRFSKEFYAGQELRSRPSIFTIDIQQDTQISVDKFQNENKAQRAINNGLDWNIISKDKQYTVEDSDVLISNGFFPYSDIEKVVASYNQQKIIATITDTVSTNTTASNTDATNIANVVSAMSSDGETIKLIYNGLSSADKKAFRMWLIEQEMQ